VDAPDYSIVVPAYNEERFLGPTLERLRAAMEGVACRGEIVVCDNNSTDRTAEVARAGGARLAHEPVNQISRARNTGARAARGRHLVFVDADTHVPEAVLVSALSGLQSGRTCGGGSTVRFDGAGPRGPIALAARLWNTLARRHRLAAGSFVFVTREAFEAVGGFSEKVYASEEIWLSRAVSRWGEPRGQEFVILEGPVVTSNRKAEWFSPGAVLATILLVVFFPFAVRSRRLCWLWYRRPSLPLPPR
jgi:cellulose synthase/poly-beta-1,6-N-acetylglucosamine synthase-like glycosyltransferase